jgi:acyl-CoA hydrolase
MEAVVKVVAEDPVSGERTHTNMAYLVYVAINEDGHPTPVPPLIVETEAEEVRRDEAEARQKARLARKDRDS